MKKGNFTLFALNNKSLLLSVLMLAVSILLTKGGTLTGYNISSVSR